MFKLGVAMLLGWVLNRQKVLDAGSNKSLSGLVVNVTSPALVIYSVCSTQRVNAEAVKLFGFGVILYAVLPLMAAGLVWLLRTAPDKRSVYQLLLVFGNVSFMGFPVVHALYGEQAIFYINLLHIPFTLMIFTYGVWLLRGRGEGMGQALGIGDLLSPGLLSGALSLVIYFFQVPVPGFVANALGFVGQVTSPLSMLLIGSMIADFSLRDLFAERKLFPLAIAKLLVFPLAGYGVARLLFSDPMMVGIITVSLAMPSGTLCAMVGQQYGAPSQASSAALGVFISTVLSMVSIPLVILGLS